MKRMHASISLKQLRTDPRRLVQLLNNGYEVDITDHRQTLASAQPSRKTKRPVPGDPAYVLEAIKNLPPLTQPAPDKDTDYKTILAEARLKDYTAHRRQIDQP